MCRFHSGYDYKRVRELLFIWHQEIDFLLNNIFSKLDLFSNNETRLVLIYEINSALL